MTAARPRPLGALAAALVLALAGCGGDGDSGSNPAPAATTGTAATATAPAGPSLAASQEIVDLVNRYAAELPDLDAVDRTDPAALAAAGAGYGDAAAAIRARLEELEAHACVERLAGEQAGVMGDIADLVTAATEGRADEVQEIGARLQALDQEALERRQDACKAQVGYRGEEDG